MATGQPVFRRDTPAQVLAAVIEREAEPLRRWRPERPEALEEVVTGACRRTPALRFEKTDELASQLSRSRRPLPCGVARRGCRSSPPRPSAISAEIVAARAPSLYHVQTGIGFEGSDHGK